MLQVSGNQVLLEGASAATNATSYRGEYRFDAIKVRNGARLVVPDGLKATDFEVGAGEVRLPQRVEVANLTVKSGAVAGSSTSLLNLTVTGVLKVESGGTLSATAKGYAGAATSTAQGGAPAGLVGSTSDAGGSHAGKGSLHAGGVAGDLYDSVYVPQLGGGGGSYDYTAGGAGGGVLQLKVGELMLDGVIEARGETRGASLRGGAGAGGSVVVDAGVIRGAGAIDVSGGDFLGCTSTWAGAGGGGRVGLYATTLSGFDPATQVKAWGGGLYSCTLAPQIGWYGGAGTVYVHAGGMSYGQLLIDSGLESGGVKRLGPDVQLPVLGTGTVTAVAAAGGDAWVTSAASFGLQWQGAWMVLDGASGTLGTYRVLQVSGNQVLLEGASAATNAASYRGEYRFDAIKVRNGARVVVPDGLKATDFEVGAGEVRLPERVTVANLTVKSGAVAGSSTSLLNLTVTGVLKVESGGTLSATAKGYAGAATSTAQGGAPAGLVGSTSDAGGSHAGKGSLHAGGVAGDLYDSVYVPQLGGGGGSYDYTAGGAGGGVLQLKVGELVLDGVIEARGETRGAISSLRGGAGAGGSVVVDAGVIRGAGAIDVSGGDFLGCTSTWAGAGGGGRVGLYATTLSGFDPATQVKAWGGGLYSCSMVVQPGWYGGAGTVYLKAAGSTNGQLFAIQRPTNNIATPTTLLPYVGTGNVGTVTPDTKVPSDLWIEPQSPTAYFPVGSVGLWLRIAGTDYRVLAEQADRRHLLLQGAAGFVGTGDAYAGVYKFDAVTVNGQFTLQTNDVVEPGTVTLVGGAQFVHP